MNIIDIVEIKIINNNKNIILVVDNTFATPALQNPLDMGADICAVTFCYQIFGRTFRLGYGGFGAK